MSTPNDPNSSSPPPSTDASGGFGYGAPQAAPRRQPVAPQSAGAGTPYGAPYGGARSLSSMSVSGADGRHPGYPNSTPGTTGLARGIVIGGMVIAALVVGVVAVNTIREVAFSPQAVAREYLNAIASGDLERADEMIEPDGKGDPGATLVTSDVLKSAENRISDVRVSRVSSGGYATVSYTLDGRTTSATLRLEREGTQAVFFDKWVIADSLAGTIAISARSSNTVSVNGVDVDLPARTYGSIRLIAYPGVYNLTIPDTSKWVVADKAKLTIGRSGRSYQSADLAVTPTAALEKEVESQVRAHLDDCAASTDARPRGCPFRVSAYGDVQGLGWKIDSYPDLSLQSDRGIRFSGESGSATATYQQRSGASSAYTTRVDTDTFSLYGDVRISGDTVRVTFS
ncbi:hypothetical protein GCM10027515_21960 [Schumannella luteola]|uniref:Uncharacterized protein n=1 Tax=Schumannella luteola TaxID=472059 RepID=A0A852YLD4_9MICO|nr:hypothetical protein [Schumannella luteola]NYH00009.1 hypothetical protein [Schumannella luteola]TPX05452.1 hypothetical protein FJ656_06055 [Schumannella luteola]